MNGSGTNHSPVLQMFSPGWQLRQWLNTMLEKPKNLIQKPCEVPHYCRVPQTVC